ncbi:MAG: Zn-dependent hydrolase [Bacteroidetes bacterium]|nr:Zn-dependent hydrolase [Bacteroidota bacterium]
MSTAPTSAGVLLLTLLAACGTPGDKGPMDQLGVDSAKYDERVRPEIYTPVRLTTDVSKLTDNERRMVPLLIEAAQIMDSLFWQEAWGRKDSLPSRRLDADTKRFFRMNYGPWDRLAGNVPFIDGVGDKPEGARFYPADMTRAEFDAWTDSTRKDLYTMVRRDAQRRLVAIPYHRYFNGPITRAADLLQRASELADDPGLKRYLLLRAEALRTDRYDASDRAWLDMRNNTIDVIIGPIETYEDQLFGYKAAHACYIAVKDQEWSRRLARFAQLMPALQRGLPVPAAYKRERPGSDAQLGAYDVIYYAGDCNAGSKTIAVNLPNDEQVQLQKGTRRLQFKNAMKAKFDHILLPISDLLVAPDQRRHVTFDAFFEDVMFHEVAHGLGIKHTINGKGTVREALLEEAGALEEGKADMLGLYMVAALRDMGEITGGDLMDNYVTFMAGVFRSVRFGASSAHGRANMLRFNFFLERGAFVREAATGTYRVDPDKMRAAMDELSALILKLQGDGALEELRTLMKDKGVVKPELQADLDRLKKASIPVDVVFEQGVDVLGLGSAH